MIVPHLEEISGIETPIIHLLLIAILFKKALSANCRFFFKKSTHNLTLLLHSKSFLFLLCFNQFLLDLSVVYLISLKRLLAQRNRSEIQKLRIVDVRNLYSFINNFNDLLTDCKKIQKMTFDSTPSI